MNLTENPAIRAVAKLFIAWGDCIRPIVQVPDVRAFSDGRWEQALDAGCGRGLYTRYLASRSGKVTAIDLSSEHIARQKSRRPPENAEYFVGSLTDLPFETGRFDFVLCSEVLEHIPDDRKATAELARVLKPGGRLVVSVPVPPAPIDDKEHVREGYSEAEIRSRLMEAGFEVDRVAFCMFGISKVVMRFLSAWTARTKIPPPSLVLLPLYLEAWLPLFRFGTPYDIILSARKR